ncbi:MULTISPECIES: hypothetical protein [unclassified Thiocapsa]|uniref:hypothetical protein n=2 Tax=Thiocapsa TaxID=1056 RepID=UPI0035B03D45
MGVYIYLTIDADRIDATEWKHFYGEARDFLTAHPDGILGLRGESIAGAERAVLSRRIECEQDDPLHRHLHVCGDLNSLMTAEGFVLYEDIGHYQANRANRAFRGDRASDNGADFLSRALARNDGDFVFCAKTQGQPYHFAILAVAILCEWRFPERALVNGNINAAQCAESIAMLAEHSGIRPPLPLLFNVDRLCSALVAPDPSVESIGRYLDIVIDPEDALSVLHKRIAPDILLEWLAREAATSDGNVTLGVTRTFRTWVEGTQDLDGLIQAACLNHAGPRWTPAQITSTLVATGVTREPEPIDGLDRLDRPDAVPSSVYSQFGNVILDMAGLSARNCRDRLGADAVVACLRKHFPDEAEDCAQIIERETAPLTQNLRGLGQWAERTARASERDLESGDGESFVRYRPGDVLSTAQEAMLRELATGLASSWASWRAEVDEAQQYDDQKRHRRLIEMIHDVGIMLTECAWSWIDAEEDIAMLDLLLRMMAPDDDTLLIANLRRGLCEHRDLCRILLGYINERESVGELERAS